MECTPCNIALEKCVRCDRDGLFVAEMKLSTNTSTRFLYVTAAFRLCLGFFRLICYHLFLKGVLWYV